MRRSDIPKSSSLDETTTTARGRQAETLAAAHLERLNLRILDRNWRNRWCELDIVAAENTPTTGSPDTARTIHFIEVKYRRNIAYGYAVEYISHDKQARLIRAAAAWCQAHRYDGPYQISVVSVEGDLTAPTINFLPGVVFG